MVQRYEIEFLGLSHRVAGLLYNAMPTESTSCWWFVVEFGKIRLYDYLDCHFPGFFQSQEVFPIAFVKPEVKKRSSFYEPVCRQSKP